MRSTRHIRSAEIAVEDVAEFIRRYATVTDPHTVKKTDGALPYPSRMQCSVCGCVSEKIRNVKVYSTGPCSNCDGTAYPQKRVDDFGDMLWRPYDIESRHGVVKPDNSRHVFQVEYIHPQWFSLFDRTLSKIVRIYTIPPAPEVQLRISLLGGTALPSLEQFFALWEYVRTADSPRRALETTKRMISSAQSAAYEYANKRRVAEVSVNGGRKEVRRVLVNLDLLEDIAHEGRLVRELLWFKKGTPIREVKLSLNRLLDSE